jgi:hypothetical protein
MNRVIIVTSNDVRVFFVDYSKKDKILGSF